MEEVKEKVQEHKEVKKSEKHKKSKLVKKIAQKCAIFIYYKLKS